MGGFRGLSLSLVLVALGCAVDTGPIPGGGGSDTVVGDAADTGDAGDPMDASDAGDPVAPEDASELNEAGDADIGEETEGGQDAADASDPDGSLPFEPPGEEIDFAFQSRLWGNEQVWLRLRSGRLSRVSTWPALYEYENFGAHNMYMTGSYPDVGGRFGAMHLDHGRRRLLLSERTSATSISDSWVPVPSRLVAVDLKTGRIDFSEELPPAYFEFHSEPGSTLAVAIDSRERWEYWLWEYRDNEFTDLSISGAIIRWPHSEALTYQGRTLVVLPDRRIVEHDGKRWRVSGLLDDLKGKIVTVGGSGDGTALCAVTDLDASGARSADGSKPPHVAFWIVTPDRTTRVDDGIRAFVGRCAIGPGGRQSAFGFVTSRNDDVVTIRVFRSSGDTRDLQQYIPSWGDLVSRGDALYVTGPDPEGYINKYDWQTLRPTELVHLGRRALACRSSDPSTPWNGWPDGPDGELYLTPPGSSVAFLRTDCHCIDCEVWGYYTVNLETSAITEVLPVRDLDFADHAISSDGRMIVVRPDHNFRVVNPDGSIDDIELLGRVEGPVHYPVAP